jgi:hypothetical protein
MCPTQFQSIFVFLDFNDVILYGKVEKQWWWSISFFQDIMNMKRDIYLYGLYFI